MYIEPTALIEQWTYIGIFIVTLLGQVGLPLPEEVTYIMAGYLASVGLVSFFGVLLFSIFVILFTDSLSYWAGYYFGNPIIKYLSRWRIFEVMIKKTEHLFIDYGTRTVFICRFIWNVRNWSPLLAGSHRMKWRDFIKADALAAVIYTPILVVIGYLFAEVLDVAIGRVLEVRFIIFVLFFLIVVVYVLRKFYLRFYGEKAKIPCFKKS